MTGTIDLTPEEKSLADEIHFDLATMTGPGIDGHAIYLKNETLIPKLLKSVLDRGAVPKVRIDYFIHPDYNLSRIKGSNRDLFERNGCKGTDIFIHPHFLPYLRFMIFGADLPPPVMAEIKEAIGEPDYFSGSDLDGVRKTVRQLVRTYGRHRIDPEEIFKFAIDLGLNTWMSRSLRDAAQSVK